MKRDDLERFAEDLRQHAGLIVELLPDADPEGLHILRIKHVDFFFYADGSGYDGWGMQIGSPDASS
jgi:hypothetical protein